VLLFVSVMAVTVTLGIVNDPTNVWLFVENVWMPFPALNVPLFSIPP